MSDNARYIGLDRKLMAVPVVAASRFEPGVALNTVRLLGGHYDCMSDQQLSAAS